jgi:hypothetical protein
MDTAGASPDLTRTPAPFVHSVEASDLHGNGNALVLDRLEILNFADNSNELFVFGDDINAVQGGLPGAAIGAAAVGGVDFQTFTAGQAELFVRTGRRCQQGRYCSCLSRSSTYALVIMNRERPPARRARLPVGAPVVRPGGSVFPRNTHCRLAEPPLAPQAISECPVGGRTQTEACGSRASGADRAALRPGRLDQASEPRRS